MKVQYHVCYFSSLLGLPAEIWNFAKLSHVQLVTQTSSRAVAILKDHIQTFLRMKYHLPDSLLLI